ncbi:MAG: hypothetical protein C4520_18960 [Candidatus Abyssobacteria bacterium SURF_5]|uniref:SGNH/GDSL hydrolase family protein n=1 Tax=Abyssobacteria bacterium (strain SURF_5) TaxID=2093360 RepID=A0A3A4N1Z2_ABYX5|nr:MAG: hypothetical protein C4520_18960 [Candidatus Abyssubacteria bacterium SURF_5]
MLKYQHSPASKKVIVGGSYASYLGEFADFQNLGIPASFTYEHVEVIENYCRPDDSIYYFITFRDALDPRPPRPEIRSRLRRGLMTLRIILLDRFHLPLPPFLPEFNYDGRYDEDDEIYKDICQSIGAKAPNMVPDLMQVQFWLLNQNTDVRPVWNDIAAAHPNVTFILSPVLPLKYECPDPLINEILRNMIIFKTMITSSHLQVIDLSDAIGPEYFIDLIHLNSAGRDLLKTLLKDTLTSSNFPFQSMND